MPARAVSRLALPLLVGLFVLTGCGGSHAVHVTGPTPTLPPGVVPTATLADLRVKLASISQDECARDSPATVYAGCGRFVREVQASLPSVRDMAPAARAAADAVDRDITAFSAPGCVDAPNAGPAGSPSVCGPALATLQRDLRTMVAAVGR